MVLLLLQSMIQTNLRDDLVFAKSLENIGLFDFLKDRYATWSSRVIIEAVMVSIITTSPLLWRILNIFIVLLLVWNTADLFAPKGEKIRAQCFFFLMMWVIPTESLCSAGWMTTTMNYLWVLSLGLMGMRPLKHFVQEEKCLKWEYLFCPLCILYAANMEQMGAILFGVYLVIGFYLFAAKKKPPLFYWVLLAEIVLSLGFILAAPGNAKRTIMETANYFPEYANLNVPEKMLMGFLESAHYYIAGGYGRVCYVFPLLTGVLLFLFVQRGVGERKKYLQLPIFLCPVLFYWGMTRLIGFLFENNYLTRGLNVIGLLLYNRDLPGNGQYAWGAVLVQALVYMILLVCVVVSVYILHGKTGETMLELMILAAGFCSRVMMGFSPTIYISGDRTALFCSAAILIVVLRNLLLFWKEAKNWKGKLLMGIYIACSIIGTI